VVTRSPEPCSTQNRRFSAACYLGREYFRGIKVSSWFTLFALVSQRTGKLMVEDVFSIANHRTRLADPGLRLGMRFDFQSGTTQHGFHCGPVGDPPVRRII